MTKFIGLKKGHQRCWFDSATLGVSSSCLGSLSPWIKMAAASLGRHNHIKRKKRLRIPKCLFSEWGNLSQEPPRTSSLSTYWSQLSPKWSMGKRNRSTEVSLNVSGFAPGAGLGPGSTFPTSLEVKIDSKPNFELCQKGSRWMECYLTTGIRSPEISWRPNWY